MNDIQQTQFHYLVESGRGGERRVAEPPSGPDLHFGKILLNRETIEQIAMAIILAFMFRAFLAEAFIIPTGSMAPTLMGRHVDLVCPQCGYRFEGGASSEEPQIDGQTPRSVVAAVCQNCRFFYQLDPKGRSAHRSFPGDRILVSKLAYGFHEPERWDVIVFKFPDDPKQNYIKRLIGLPGESITIYTGDIYTGRDIDGPSDIARKPPEKILAMGQLVYDTKYAPAGLYRAGFPQRWQPATKESAWSQSKDGSTHAIKQPPAEIDWLHYRHILPFSSDWRALAEARPVPTIRRLPQLITDFYAYNARADESVRQIASGAHRPGLVNGRRGDDLARGLHWVGDLTMAADIELMDGKGVIVLELIEAGRRHTCSIDVATGKATLQLDGGVIPLGEGKNETPQVTAATPIKGAGRYQVRLANVDNQLVLWVNDRVVSFDGPTTYVVDPFAELPAWSKAEPGDFAPARIGVQGVAATVHRLQLHRDIYYVANDRNAPLGEYEGIVRYEQVRESMMNPKAWDRYDIFRRRQWIRFELGDDHFFPLGDNSPQSSDARAWLGGHFVERRLLTGKALAVFWPHPLRRPIPFFPNFRRMKWIR